MNNIVKFCDLYDDEKRSKHPKLIRTADKKIWKYNFISRTYETIDEKDVKALHSVVEFIFKGENALKTKGDMITYCNFIKNDICKNCLGLDNWNFDFAKIEQLIKFLVDKSIKEKIIVENTQGLIDTIDEASAGGVLIAEKGKHEGKYSLFDINNSYNKFFTDYNLPSNPKFETVDKISKKVFRLYRLFIKEEYRTKEYNTKFKTSRKWFTYFDIKIFRMFGISFELVKQENNCISFETVDCDFEWMEKLNELKQQSSGIKKDILKLLLSSVWGKICCYETQPQIFDDDELPEQYKNKQNTFVGKIDRKYFLRVYPETGDNEYINPQQRFKYSVGIVKPFVLAYARLRLFEQIKKIEDKGKKVIYAHTDSIITDAKKKYFDIGTEIGQFKHEQTSEKGIIINNIASKQFL